MVTHCWPLFNYSQEKKIWRKTQRYSKKAGIAALTYFKKIEEKIYGGQGERGL